MRACGFKVQVKDFGRVTEESWYGDREEECHEELRGGQDRVCL